MASSIEVNKKRVCDFLAEGKEHKFIIPEYQRPYEWDQEQVDTLFDDLWEFSASDKDESEDYFLGCIVFFENEGEYEIIDGQQRLTSLFLFLRAIYAALESGEESKQSKNFMGKIEKSIWPEDDLTGEVFKDRTLLESRVVDSQFGDVLTDILTTGSAVDGHEDHYSENFRRFQSRFKEAAAENSLSIYQFLNDITKHVIIFPIQADTQETALRIFSTLNDRGLPLSDADIFKAKIYGFLDDAQKEQFIKEWKALDERANESGESIQRLFYYYMFYLRAQEEDVSTTTPGVRRYYAENKFSRLKDPTLMDDLNAMMDVWEVVNARMTDEEKSWTRNTEIRKTLDTLNMYPNEFWKYPVTVYYLEHRNVEGFEDKFLAFLKKLAAEMFAKFLKTPTVSAVKPGVMKLNASILKSDTPEFEFGDVDWKSIRDQIKLPNKRSFRMLLALHAYTEQDDLLPAKWEIEHIFPKKWQSSHFPTYDESIVNEKIEHIGNKAPFEKKLNIVASNGYFEKKQKEYEKSKVEVTRVLSEKSPASWELPDIDERDVRVTDAIIETLKKWSGNYQASTEDASTSIMSDEDAEALKALKEKYGDSILGEWASHQSEE